MMEGQQQGNPNDSFGQDSQLLDGQEAILDIWWSQACNIEEMAGEQGFVTGASLPDQQGNEVMGVDDMNLSLNGEGGGDDLVQWNLERIFDIVPNDSREDGNGLSMLQAVYQSPPPSAAVPPPQQLEALQPHQFYGVLPDSDHANLEVPVDAGIESMFSGQALSSSEESANQELNLENLNVDPIVLLERLPPPPPPPVLEQSLVLDSSPPLRPPPPPLVESPVKNYPCLVLNPLNNQNHHAPPPLIRRPEAVRQMPPPPPLVKRPEIENRNLPPSPSLPSSLQPVDEAVATITSKSTRGSKRKKVISTAFKANSGSTVNGVKASSGKKRRSPTKKKVKPTEPIGWVEDDVWEYEEIIEARRLKNVSKSSNRGSKNVYYVKWKGWSSLYNHWLPEKDFVDTWPLGQFWKNTLEGFNKRNMRINKVPSTTIPTPPRPDYFM